MIITELIRCLNYCEYNSCAKFNDVLRNQLCSEILLAQDLGKALFIVIIESLLNIG